MNDLLAWLTARIEQAEREAPHAHERGCFAWDDYHYRHGRDLDDPQPTAGDACECSGPLRAAARVEAERVLLARGERLRDEWNRTGCLGPRPDGMLPADYMEMRAVGGALAALAWGHRFDAPGFLAEWAAGCAGCDYVARDTDLDRATGRLTSHVMVAGLPSRAGG